MVGMDHGGVTSDVQQSEGTTRRNSRYGLILFAIYLVFYGAFMLLTAFSAKTMAQPAIGGANLAIVSGLGLIVLAFILSLVYGWLCRREV
ncbi:MAG TPA: DUF485 domain-containing protein [Pirellulaceae bacterium]|nr:DUF485 domain-containing protein [Pirellulaceae bacterium]